MPRTSLRALAIRAQATHFGMAFGAVALLALLLQVSDAVRPPWQAQFPPLRTATIIVSEMPLEVELAISPEERARGLGYREGLAPGTGMLFVTDEAAVQNFWMKGMRFCLDIVWIDGGQIVGADENACPDPEGTADGERARFSSEVPVSYVLEVPAGWLAERGYGAGTPVTGLPAAVAVDA